ncbi:MAG TPA: asparagine synthase (glutamine-hydrolyzing) [Bryobacteraceae bacterium]|nr:asparagine synthase (glutamine-hydrolyzing) [Bryobacteraceae bacterium]
MCGIAGFVTIVPDAAPGAGGEAVLRRMTGRLRHRGPDDSGFYSDGRAFLGHRRLSIIDVAGGHQPVSNENGSVWITYNGEIFNHAAIRPRLERAGHRYVSKSDTETVVHAYEEFGPACLDQFRGMFAFAIWDGNARSLFCARDRLGIKPFYYYWDGRLFAFASEIKALLEHPSIPAEFEETLLGEYLGFGYVSGDRTLFRNIRKLMPGHHLRLSCSSEKPQIAIAQYWDVPRASERRQYVTCQSEQDWIGETRRRLEETVRMRLMSDVPLGMFLSGGVDSSAIAALIKRNTDGPVKTFAVGYCEADFSELGYAAEVARAIGTDHHEIVIGQDEFFGALPELIWHEDEPIAWPSSVSLYFVSKLAAEQVKVVLTGEGSDELFGGYERYRWNLLNQRYAPLYGLVPKTIRGGIRNGVATSKLLRASVRRKIEHTFVGRGSTLESLYLDNFYCAFSAEQQARLLRKSAGAIYSSYREYWDARAGEPVLARMLYADQKTYLVELLMKQDQMSMACSIESRVPFLDHHFVEFAMQMPDDLKIRGTTQKYALKKAVEDLLPHEIVYRKKMGFPTPLRQWLLEAQAQPKLAALQDPDNWLAAYIDLDEVNRLLDLHRTGQVDATDRIWRLLNLQIWGDVFFTGKRERWHAAVGEAAPHPA